VAALEVEKAELKDRMLRIAAEFENYKKRTRKEMSEHEAKTREAVLPRFLGHRGQLTACHRFRGRRRRKGCQVGPGWRRAGLAPLQSRSWKRYSVTAIEAKGQPFDPRLHDAISQAPSSEATPGHGAARTAEGLSRG